MKNNKKVLEIKALYTSLKYYDAVQMSNLKKIY